MPLNTPGLQSSFEQLLSDMETRDVDAKHEFAQRFGQMMEVFVKSGDVKAGIALTAGGNAGVTTAVGIIE